MNIAATIAFSAHGAEARLSSWCGSSSFLVSSAPVWRWGGKCAEMIDSLVARHDTLTDSGAGGVGVAAQRSGTREGMATSDFYAATSDSTTRLWCRLNPRSDSQHGAGRVD